MALTFAKKMNKSLIIKLYQDRGYGAKKQEKAIAAILNMEKYLLEKSTDFENADIPIVKSYIQTMIEQKKNDLESLLAIARYYYLIDKKDIYIYFTKILGGLGVIENIKKRCTRFAGKDTTQKVFENLTLPQLGTPLEDIPVFTNALMDRINQLIVPNLYQKILAGNNHGISKESMKTEKEFYENSKSFNHYLQERHQRKVAELQAYCDHNKVWFEQIISQEIVNYVKANQEILSAVHQGNKLYVTKIPFDANRYLEETNPVMRRYYACHCPFAREAIRNKENSVSSEWCYCSAGFAKYPFEVILDRELDVKVINSALNGDDICRFEIDLNAG